MIVKFCFDNFFRDLSLLSEEELDRPIELAINARREILEKFYGRAFSHGVFTAELDSRNLVCATCSKGDGDWCSDCMDRGEDLPITRVRSWYVCPPEVHFLFKDCSVLFQPGGSSDLGRFEDYVKDSVFLQRNSLRWL